MENVVPGTLQRLRATDIIHMAELAAASLGQEYYRIGAVHSTQRQGGRIAGVVNVPDVANKAASTTNTVTVKSQTEETLGSRTRVRKSSYPVDVEIQSVTQWTSECPCGLNPPNVPTLCPHAAALLYQWLARPMTFVTDTPPLEIPISRPVEGIPQEQREETEARTSRPLTAIKPAVPQHGPAPLGSLADILTQLGLSELRGIAREYELVTNGMNKQQLAEVIQDELKQPELVRRVAATLEKPQRQLLAALTLAGGSMMDEDLRGLFERFSLGQPNQLQAILIALQGKGLLFRTSLNSSPQQRIGLSGALLDVGWYVPEEVRSALHVTAPVTPFDVNAEKSEVHTVQKAALYNLLTDLLLVARGLDGYRLTNDDLKDERGPTSRPAGTFSTPRTTNSLTSDGSIPLPPPPDMASSSLLVSLRASLSRSPALLRFAVRLLRLADILHKDDNGTPYLRVLPNAAQLLLGPTRAEVLHDLFELWLAQSSYDELFDLGEDGLRLRCRATSLNHPILRSGELESENSEARQSLVALLAQVPLNQWISFNAFARFVYRINPLFLQKRQRLFTSPHWWIEQEEGRPLHPLQLSDWLRAEIHYLTRLLRGPLHWWGACDLALARDGRLLAFRLTPTAGWLLSGTRSEPQEEEKDSAIIAPSDTLEVIDNQEVLVSCSVSTWPIIELMEAFTEVAGIHRDRLRYCITPKALSSALSQGRHPASLLELLRSVISDKANSLLSTLLTQIERWVASYGRVRIYTGVSLLETADTMVMRELSATTSLDEQIVQTIHPTLHILKKSGAERVIDDLKRRGQTPLLHDEE